MGCIGTVQMGKALISIYFTSALRTSRRDFNFLILSWIIGLTQIMSWVWTLTFSHHMRMQQMIRIPGFFATNDPQVGFPRDCGPTGYQPHQWNRFYNNGGRHNWAYFVEKNAPTDAF